MLYVILPFYSNQRIYTVETEVASPAEPMQCTECLAETNARSTGLMASTESQSKEGWVGSPAESVQCRVPSKIQCTTSLKGLLSKHRVIN